MIDPALIGLISVGALIVLVLVGFHIGLSLALTSFVALYAITGRFRVAASVLETTSFTAINDYIFAVIPLFVLMGLLTTASGATRELFSAAEALLRRCRGGLGIATVMANAVFAAVTGVSVASAAVFSKIAIPEMKRLNYNARFSLGIVASSSLLGMIIPPSVLMIIYGVITEQSIGRLFAAGVLPGILIAAALGTAIYGLVVLRPGLIGATAASTAEADGPDAERHASDRRAVLRPWPIYTLVVGMLGGIYGGIFTPTEAGAIGAFCAFIIVIVRRRFSFRSTLEILLETGKTTASIFFLLIAAQIYSRMLTLSGFPAEITEYVSALQIAPTTVVLIFMGILLVLGMILDSGSILLLVMPIMFPVVHALGIDPIWFGIVSIVTIEIGLLTPPFGLVIFTMKAALPPEVSLEDIYIGSAPFILVLVAVLALLIAFPSITLWLPNRLWG